MSQEFKHKYISLNIFIYREDYDLLELTDEKDQSEADLNINITF